MVERKGHELQMASDEIVTGDEMVLSGGDQISVDGTILAGSAAVDQRQLTGDSTALTCQPGDEVYAAMIVVDGYLRLSPPYGVRHPCGQSDGIRGDGTGTDTRVSNYPRKVGNPAVMPTVAVGAAVLAASGSIPRRRYREP